jgi:hypothetical protein
MLNDMDIHTGSNRPSDAFPHRTLDNLFHCKIGLRWLLPMEQSGGYPNFVSHLDAGFGDYSHGENPLARMILNQVKMKCQLIGVFEACQERRWQRRRCCR